MNNYLDPGFQSPPGKQKPQVRHIENKRHENSTTQFGVRSQKKKKIAFIFTDSAFKSYKFLSN